MAFASKEPKARQTAEIVGARLRRPVEVADDLHENDRTGVAYLSNDAYATALRSFFDNPSRLVLGNETAEQALERFSRAVNGLLPTHGDTDLVVVTHGTVITLLVAKANDLDPFVLWNRLGLPSFVVLSRPTLRLVEIVDRVE